MDRYNTLAIAKEEAEEKHHIQLQEVRLNEGDARWLYDINSCIVLHSFQSSIYTLLYACIVHGVIY